MGKPQVAERGRKSTVPWLAGAAIAAFAVLLVALIRVRVSYEVLAGVAAACVAGMVSIVLAVINQQDRQRERDERQKIQDREAAERINTRQEENVLRALEYFTGQTQRRNVGIAIVEGYWHTTPHLRGILVPLLVNQAVYLLEQSKKQESCMRPMG
jgi:hypothetical protein